MHSYPEYEADVQAAFADIAAKKGMAIASPIWYKHPELEIRVSIDQMKVSVHLFRPGTDSLYLIEDLIKATGESKDKYLGTDETGTREAAQAYLQGAARFISAHISKLLKGDWSDFELPDPAAERYEKRLRDYVYANAPIAHPARTGLFQAGWKVQAERFAKEKGLDLNSLKG